MSISAVTGVSPVSSQPAGPGGVTSIPPATSFGQELEAQGAKAGVAHGHHQGGGGSGSVTSSPAIAASAAGVTLPSTIMASLQHLLS
jgi:hypothetical protein